MKRADKSSATVKRNFLELISVLSEGEILNLHEMRCVRGGVGEGGGDIIIIPPKPPIVP